jgi:aryl-alcohol dehydrogenase-like predicted oxidoreductase
MKPSKLVLGTAQLGQTYGIANSSGKPDTSTAYKILETAYNNGITTLDTANSYGNSEKVIGDFTARHKIKFNIITKVPSFKAAENGDTFNAHLERSFASSLKALKAGSIYGLMLHDYNDYLEHKDEVLSFFSDLKADGHVQKTGLSVYSPIDVDKGIDIIQCPMSLLDVRPLISGFIEKAKAKRTELHVRSIFLQGLFFLTRKDLMKKLPAADKYIKAAQSIGARNKLTIKELAFSFVRDSIGDGSMVIGAETPEQILENIKLLNKPALSDKLKKEITDTFSSVPELIIDPSLWGK